MTPKEREEVLAQLTAWWAGELPEAQGILLEAEVRADPKLRAEAAALKSLWDDLGEMSPPVPSPYLATRFRAAVKGYEEGRSRKRNTAGWLGAWREWLPGPAMAGAAMLALGFLFGYGYHRQEAGAERVVKLEQQVDSMTKLVALALLNDRSASGRIQAMQWAERSRPSEELADSLLHVLNYDENDNVRLEAVSALRRMSYQPPVRKKLVEAMSRQSSPLVQIALIDTYRQMEERSATPIVRRVAEDPNAHEMVRQRAIVCLKEWDNF